MSAVFSSRTEGEQFKEAEVDEEEDGDAAADLIDGAPVCQKIMMVKRKRASPCSLVKLLITVGTSTHPSGTVLAIT